MKFFNHKITKIERLKSTNDYIRLNTDNKKFVNGDVIVASYQTTGKGQGQNNWESEYGMNLIFSLILVEPNLDADKQFYLSKAISVAICNYLNSYGLKFEIKWPNDIYFEREKIAGILIENTIQSNRISETVIGVGLNLNQVEFSKNIPNPVSLKLLTGNDYDLDEELLKLLNSIDNQLTLLIDKKFNEINYQYFNCLFLFNISGKFLHKGNLIEGKIIDVDEFGYLKIENKNSEILSFGYKEVEYVL